MFESLFIGLAFSLIIYAFLCVADIITEHIIQKIEKHTNKSLEDFFLPWYEEEP